MDNIKSMGLPWEWDLVWATNGNWNEMQTRRVISAHLKQL